MTRDTLVLRASLSFPRESPHLLQGWVLAKREHLHGPVPEEAPASATLSPRVTAWHVQKVLQTRAASVQEMVWLQVTSPWLCPCSWGE